MNKLTAFLTQPVTFDGFVYVMIAVFAAIAASLSSDDAAKYIAPSTLWIFRQVAQWVGAAFLAVKMYRSTTFSEYRQAKNGTYHTGNTEVITKQEPK